MTNISVLIITKNNEDKIEGCLKSLTWADEIIIIDSFSEDKTIEICKKYTDKIYQYQWQGYAIQRNRAIELAQNPWLLFVDSDERVSSTLKENILKIPKIKNNPYSAYNIKFKNFHLGKLLKYGGWDFDVIRLIKKGKVSYNIEKRVHEEFLIKGKIGNLSGYMYHLSHCNISEIINKIEKYSILEAEDMLNSIPQVNSWLLVKKTISHFWQRYITYRGFKDGIEGLIESVLQAFYIFSNYAKLWELQHKEIKEFYKNCDEILANIEFVDCEICGYRHSQNLYNKNYYFYNIKIELVKCKHCGLIYLNPRPKLEKIETIIQTSKNDILKILKIVKKYKKEGKWLNLSYNKEDLSSFIQSYGYTIYTYKVEDLTALNEKMDIIFIDKILEYNFSILAQIYRILKDDGIIVINYISNYKIIKSNFPFYIFNDEILKKLLTKENYKILKPLIFINLPKNIIFAKKIK